MTNNIDKKFKYDICRTVGHEIDSHDFVCTRCEYNVFAKKLEEILSAQFVGRKITRETPYNIQLTAIRILTDFVNDGIIIAFKNLEVRSFVVNQHEISFDVTIPQSYDSISMSILLT